MRKADILDRLVCPACRGPLTATGEGRRCAGCALDFPVVDGVPVMLADGHEILSESASGRSGGPRSRASRLLDAVVRRLPEGHYAPEASRAFAELAGALPPDASALAVGGGLRELGRDIRALGPELLARTVNLEVAPGPVVDVAADGHAIPFPDATFDLVVSQAVLEHVRKPWIVVAEMRRVLKPGGWIYVDVPFLHHVHMHSDFWRFTPRGLSELMGEFEAVREGVNSGVAAASVHVNAALWASLLSAGRPTLYRGLFRLLRRLFAPLNWLDAPLARRRLPADAPASVYFLGRRP